jgi:hypothetical protein
MVQRRWVGCQQLVLGQMQNITPLLNLLILMILLVLVILKRTSVLIRQYRDFVHNEE